MKFCPKRGDLVTVIGGEPPLEDQPQSRYQIQGRVETAWFAVNVSWSIELNAVKEIMFVEVKLLATLPDLLRLKHSLS